MKKLREWWNRLSETKKAAIRSTVTTFLVTLSGLITTEVAQSLVDSGNPVNVLWPLVLSALMTGARTGIVALNPKDPSYGRNAIDPYNPPELPQAEEPPTEEPPSEDPPSGG